MAREQPSTWDLLPLLETSDLRQLEEIKGLINEHLSTERGSMLLNGLVDYFLETNSNQAMNILSSVREPHDKHLLEKMNECMNRPACRLSTLTLLGHVVRKQPSWIHKIARYPLLLSLLKCLKTDSDVVVLITGLLVLVTLLPTIPQAGKQHLYEFFDIFGRLASWNLKNPGHISEVYLIHLHASVYSLFHRLYGMYPCNFVSYLRSHYSMKENLETFEEVIKPMLEHVRIHPELVTGTKDHELDPTRWKRFEIHDIVIECAKVSLDPKEASCEEGYITMPDSFFPHQQLRPQDCTSSPYTDFYSSYGSSSSTTYSTPRQPLAPPMSLPPFSGSSYRSPQTSRHQNSSCELSSACGGKDPLWSPSSLCGMATPPSSRGMSPNAELSQSASHLPGRFNSTSGGKGTPASSTPAPSSPPPSLSEDLSTDALTSSTSSAPQKEGGAVESKPSLVRQEPVREQEKEAGEGGEGEEAALQGPDASGVAAETVSMTLTELSVFMKEQELQEKEREEASITEELLKITEEQRDQSGRRSVDSPFYRTTETLTGPREKPRPHPALGGPPRDPHRALSTPGEGAVGGGGDSRTSSQEQPWVFQPAVFTPIERLVLRSPQTLEDEGTKFQLLSLSPCINPSLPYEALFDLALPRAASLFVGRRTTEARARLEAGGEAGGEVEGETSASPLEVLDRLVQQGSDAHHKVLKRLPLPSKSADWTHFGGSAPLDELQTQHSQLQLLHGQLLYERYKREQHAVRNRRLLRRIINATALEEQNNAMKAQLSLQAVDMLSLRESLQVEQQRNRQLREDKASLVSRLQAQVHTLQLGRDTFYTRNLELQSKLQEYQKRLGELEAELQKANNKVCHTGHLLQQMTIKLSSSESTQQQMSFLNKQLLLLGEAHKLCMQELANAGPDTSKESQMVRASWGQEVGSLRQSLLQQGQRVEAAQHRVGELETLLSKKEHLITEQKKFLEDIKGQARAELQASEDRYQAQRRVTLLLQTELLQLYSRLETERPACTSSSPPVGGSEHAGQPSVIATDGPMRSHLCEYPDNRPPPCPRGNGSTLSPGQPKAKAPETTNSVNGNQDSPPPPLLVEPPLTSSPPDPAPLTVGSYPSAKSFLGIRARELFRNKSESQCDEDSTLPAPRLAGLAHCLKTELCVESPPTVDPPGPRQGATPPKEAPTEHRQKLGGPGSPRRKTGVGGPVRAGGGMGAGLGRVGGVGGGAR